MVYGLIPTFSISYVEVNASLESFSKMLQKASSAMQFAKKKNANIVKYNEEIYIELEHKNTIKRYAEIGLRKDEFYPVYQEKVNTISEEIVGVEALARWESEALGLVGPNEFIPVMSESSLILDFTEKMIDYILKDYEKLVEKYHENIKVSINISPLYFMSDNFVGNLLEKAREYQVPFTNIILEITEDILLGNLKKVNTRILVLRQTGVKVSLDDFGSGYSSLNYLTNIALDEIKIDKIFIDNIVEDIGAYKFFRSIIDVINNLGCETVAEGVETKEQLDLVQNSGCKIVQGYYYSKPKRLM